MTVIIGAVVGGLFGTLLSLIIGIEKRVYLLEEKQKEREKIK